MASASAATSVCARLQCAGDAFAEEGRGQGGAGPGDRQPVADQAVVRGRPVIGRRADGGEHQRQREHPPGSERRARRRRPAQSPERPDADREERQVAQHVGRIRQAEPGAIVGEGVVVGPLPDRPVRPEQAGEGDGRQRQPAGARQPARPAERRSEGTHGEAPCRWYRGEDGAESGASSAPRTPGRQALRSPCSASAPAVARRASRRGGSRRQRENASKAAHRRGRRATRSDVDVASTRGPLLRWLPLPLDAHPMTLHRKPNLLGALSAVGSWAACNGMAPRSGGVRAPI